MEMVEMIIKIPEELYKAYKGRPPMLGDAGMDMIVQSIANGTPLPKGYGRLIDADSMKRIDAIQMGDFNSIESIRAWIDIMPTVIEADKEAENESD